MECFLHLIILHFFAWCRHIMVHKDAKQYTSATHTGHTGLDTVSHY